jgi:hypothetical protein
LRVSALSLRPLLAVVAVALAACSGGNKTKPDSGVADSGPTTLEFCIPQSSPCDAGTGCCGNLSCQSGTCQETTPAPCVPYGGLCSASAKCCEPTAPTGGWPAGSVPPNLGCLASDAGISYCFIGGQVGDPCSASTWGCTNGLSCTSGKCQVPITGQICPPATGTTCNAGDDCSAYASSLVYYCGGSQNSDPCQNSGLNCVQTAQLGGSCPLASHTFTCMEPSVQNPPYFQIYLEPEELSPTYAQTLCGTGSDCVPAPGDTAAPTCGTWFVDTFLYGTYPDSGPITIPVCMEACTKPDDCGSLALDCVSGQCVPNFCYAQPDLENDDIAGAITQAQPNAPVTDNIDVLFKPCAHGGPNTVCLPQDDEMYYTVTGICYRVGGAGAGGPGASCDPSGARTDLGGLCQSGTLCYKGTCLPWCDTGNQTVAPCAANQQCVVFGGELPWSTADANGTGVCTEDCDPYQPAAQNSCPQVSGQPPYVCKPAGTDSDQFPSPGACVGGSTAPAAVGATCSPYGWLDPCVSGAACAPNKAQNGFVCGQICDPSPSPGVTEPACPTGQTCTPQGPPICQNANNSATNYVCNHIGVCL